MDWPRRRNVLMATPLALACGGFAARVSAEPAHWLSVEGACSVSAREVSRRVDTELIGVRRAGVRAHLQIEAVAPGYRVELRAARSGEELGDKQLVVPNCDEALDAAVLVLAIALTEPAAGPPGSDPVEPSGSSSASSSSSLEFLAPPSALPRDEPVLTQNDRAIGPTRRVGALVGIETGIAPLPAAYLGASFASAFDAWELWSALRYGLPTEEESVETGNSERIRRDFGALGLSLCRGAGAAWRLSLCAGGELGWIRVDRAQREGGDQVETDENRVRLAGVGTARLTGLVAGVRPELDISAAMEPWGPDGAVNLGFRLGGGVALQF